MSDISKIILPDGNQYDLKDAIARTEVTTTSSGLMSANDKIKLNLIENEAQKNIIESISVNGDEIEPINKNIDIEVPSILETCDEKIVSGNLIHIEDAVASSANIKINFSPIQNLNGYDHPWAGGTGRNKLLSREPSTTTLYGMTWIFNADGTTSAIGTATQQANAYLPGGSSGRFVFGVDIPNVPLIFSKNIIGTGSDSCSCFAQGYRNGTAVITYHDGDIIDPISNNIEQLRITMRIVKDVYVDVIFSPMLRLAADTDDTFEPYSNICPINGYTGTTIVKTGKNLIPFPYYNDTVTKNGVTFTVDSDGGIIVSGTATATADFFIIRRLEGFPNGNFIMNLSGEWASTGEAYIHFRTADTEGYKNIYISSGDTPFIVKNRFFLDCVLRVTNGTTVNGKVYPMIRFASDADTTYKPYINTIYPITFSSAENIIYGGTLIINNDGSGTLTVNYKSKTYNGTESWVAYSSHGYHVTNSDMKSGTWWDDPNTLCNEFIKIADNSTIGIRPGVNNTEIYVVQVNGNLADVTNLTTWKVWLSSNPLTITYPLATPIIYTLNALQVIQMLQGENNIWTDINSNIDLTYKTRFTIITPEERNKLNNIPFNAVPNYFGVCSDSGVTREITVDSSFTLTEGVMINVFFENQSASQATLNVNDTGAYPIYIYGTQVVSNSIHWGWRDNQLVELVFHDSKWWIQNQYFNNAGTTNSGLMTSSHVTKLNSLDPNSITPIQLTNEDLNDIHPLVTTWYYADGTNTCAHKPTGTTVTAFGMLCFRTANTYMLQIVFPHTTNRTFTRYYTGSSWSAWRDQSITYNAASGWPGLMSAADKVKLDGLKASTLNVTDTYGVTGTAGATVTIQDLMDAIASKV